MKQPLWNRLIPIACFLGGVFLFLSSLLLDLEHDWDLDSFLYLGSRLDQGELLYVQDFETKLPFLQYLFWVAYRLGGIGAWKLMTFIGCLVMSWAASAALSFSIQSASTKKKMSIAFWLTAFFLLRIYSLPSSDSAHIEMLSAACMYYAIALCLSVNDYQALMPWRILLAGVFAGLATLIRPNYLYTLPAFFILWTYLCLFQRSKGVVHYIKKLTIFCLGFGGLISISFVPYLFIIGGLDRLVSALRAIAFFPKLDQLNIIRVQLREILTIDFFIALLIAMLAVVVMLIYRRATIKRHPQLLAATVFTLAALVGLEYSFIRTHYTTHNSILFLPYFMILLWIIYETFQERLEAVFNHGGVQRLHLVMSIVILCLVLTIQPVFKILQKSHILFTRSEGFNPFINERNVDKNLMLFLSGLSSSTSWYVVDGSSYHAVLRQSRIGDGHPAMLQNIFSGIRIGPVDNLYLYSEDVFRSPCLALFQSRKELIIVKRDSDNILNKAAVECLLSDSSPYKELDAANFSDLSKVNSDSKSLASYRFFKRH